MLYNVENPKSDFVSVSFLTSDQRYFNKIETTLIQGGNVAWVTSLDIKLISLNG